MSLSAIMRSRTKCMKYWQMDEMDNVLNTGNELYGFLQRSSTMSNDEYLLVSELPTELNVYENNFSMNYGEPVTGTLNENDPSLGEYGMISLRNAVEQTIQIYQACFICFHGSTFAVIAEDGIYHVFDSHSKNVHGSQVEDGTSIMMLAVSWQGVYRYCLNLAQSMNLSVNEQFEITGVNLCISDNALTGTQEHMQANLTCTDSVVDDCKDRSTDMLQDDVVDLTLEDDDQSQSSSTCGYGNSVDDGSNDSDNGSVNYNNLNSHYIQGDVLHADTGMGSESLDIEIIGQSRPNVMTFSPLTFEVRQSLCDKFEIEKSHLKSSFVSEECAVIGKPNHVEKIRGDGNCFFRAISYALSGSENSHEV